MLRRKIRAWLYDRYLPAITKAEYLRDIDELQKALKAQQSHIKELEAYIDGVQDTLRRTSIRIVNTNNGGSNDRQDASV